MEGAEEDVLELEQMTGDLRGVDEEITDVHINEICGTHCDRWRDLPPYLELDRIVVNEIKRDYGDERERRKGFFSRWKERRGSRATYRSLIRALLRIGCREDAEHVCSVLRSQQPPQQASDSSSNGGKLRGHINNS